MTTPTVHPSPVLLACPQCDLLHRETTLPHGAHASCRRCGAVLYEHRERGLENSLAFVLAAAVLMLIANTFPIVKLDMQGRHTEATLLGAVQMLYEQGMPAIAALVLLTTLVAPAVELAALVYMLLSLRHDRMMRHLRVAFRLVPFMRLWGMVDVFMLGVLVALAKLGQLAGVVPGIALWSFGALVLLLAATATSFDGRELWRRVRRA